MQTDKLLSLTERLENILEKAEQEAKEKVSDAQQRANEMVSKAKVDADRKKSMTQRSSGIENLLKAEEEKAKKEAEIILEQYNKDVTELGKVSKKKVDSAIDAILKEVLPK